MFEVKRVLPVRGLNFNVDLEYHGHFNYGPFIELKAEINNNYDNYAVAVYYGEWNEKVKVGYLPQEENEFYHQYLLVGGEYTARVSYLNKESTNHSWDYLFVEVSLQLKKQSEFDLFLKLNKLNDSENLDIQRWIKKTKSSNPSIPDGRRGYLFDIMVTHYDPGPMIFMGKFLPKENIQGWINVGRGNKVPYGKLVDVTLEEVGKGKYKIINQHQPDGSIVEIDDDFIYT